jgi:hypothetical protein
MPTQEQLSPEDDQEREVYARYGSAMYYGQSLEVELKGALVLAKLRESSILTQDDFDATWTTNFKATLGTLLSRIKPYSADDDELSEDLQLALRVRNQLAHHFFWDHTKDILTPAGRQRMIDECAAAVALLNDLRGRIWAVSVRYADAMDIVTEPWDEALAVSRAEGAAVDSQGDRVCGRCGVEMVPAGTARRPYWECSNCHAVALT